jgi:hypothetical protein
MRVKDSLGKFIGKTVSGVLFAQYPEGSPRCHIYLTFSDGTAFELWEDDYGVGMAGCLEHGTVDQIAQRLRNRNGADIVAFRPDHQDPGNPQQDWLCGCIKVDE